ncbi:hypothetical protein DM01DRAFT_1338364 [Hesseltinella vesiculosa]|uniref:Uncharacterized protein n=1 Tax=Hesseltinella vesiculosa TaxID=101127 RepID=A0A1X2GAK1_9FUNG|nr:hypothetical protein DM01DRAFT_1338364 [Hesseltinella vesiculosa]
MSMKIETEDDLWSGSAAGAGSNLEWPPLLNDPCLTAPSSLEHSMHHPPPLHTPSHPIHPSVMTTPNLAGHPTDALMSPTSPPVTAPSRPSRQTARQPTALAQGKLTHPEWGVMKDHEFHPLAHKHQRDLENLYQTNSSLSDFYFWQANLGGYCMADMNQNMVVSSDQVFVLIRKIVDGAPHPGRRKKKA